MFPPVHKQHEIQDLNLNQQCSEVCEIPVVSAVISETSGQGPSKWTEDRAVITQNGRQKKRGAVKSIKPNDGPGQTSTDQQGQEPLLALWDINS